MTRFSRPSPTAATRDAQLVAAAFVAFAAALAIGLAQPPAAAFAHEADDGTSTCTITDEQRAAYEADGTLAEREAYQEALGNDQPDSGLIQQAVARQATQDGTALYSVPTSWESGMATQGRAHVLALRVSFPDEQFGENDTLEALQALIGPASEGEAATPGSGTYPYESLSAYYYRASYGKLTITGEAMDYTAQHPRDYYTNNAVALFKEALEALDATEDLTRFDANGDGKMDAVYIHFAGADTGWGSTWWSNEQTSSDPNAVYANGAVRLHNVVMLHNNSANATATNTIIHETGHVLGLPDYYSYRDQTTPSSSRTGILTFDMMMQNTGDHNGFSKWVLGWIDGDDVVRIVANSEGTTVKRGGAVIAQYPAGEPVEQTLAAISSDDVGETGGIIVVSNEDEGMFSSYYVLEYDAYGGNNSVFYRNDSGENVELPSGFRLFRIQASLTADGSNWLATNNGGTVNDQLIELVDPDMTATHIDTSGCVPGTLGATYGCLYYAGDTVSPQGYPSTNFFENINVGFTGLTLTFLESEGTSGTVAVSYSEDDKPIAPTELTLTPTFDTMSNAQTLTFEASSAVLLTSDDTIRPRLIVDGEQHRIANVRVDGTTVVADLFLNPGDIGPDSSCEIVFPTGQFIVSESGGATTVSSEIRMTLQPNASMTTIAQSGTYAEASYSGSIAQVSTAAICADGAQRFVQVSNGQLRLHTIDLSNLAHVTTVATEAPSRLQESGAVLSLQSLSNGQLLLTAHTNATFSCFWIDADTGSIAASYETSYLYGMSATDVGNGNVLLASMYTGESAGVPRSGVLFTLLSARGDNAADTHYGWTAYQTVVPTGNGTLACTDLLDSEAAARRNVTVVDAERIAEAVAESTYGAIDAPLGGDLCTDECTVATLVGDEARTLIAADATENGYALLFTPSYASAGLMNNLVVTYDAAGSEQARATVELAQGGIEAYTAVNLGEHGAVALSCTAAYGTIETVACQTVLFLDADLQPTSTLVASGSTLGTWMGDGSWIVLGEDITKMVGPRGTPADGTEAANVEEPNKVYYTITEPIDVAGPDDPDDPDVPVGPDNPDTPAEPDGDTTQASDGTASPTPLARTSDAATAATAAAAAAMLAAAAAAVLAARQRRRKQ